MAQFISEFITESVEILEKLANPSAPPLSKEDIERRGAQLMGGGTTDVGAMQALTGMEDAFRQRGDLHGWSDEIMARIDKCFTKNYHTSGSICETLFFPDNADNQNRFTQYCSDVDQVLRANERLAPKYAREYFAYYAIWKRRGYAFPMPLGTASVIEALNTLMLRYQDGIREVSSILSLLLYIHMWPQITLHELDTMIHCHYPQVISWMGTCVSWAPRLGLKVHTTWDQSEAAITTVCQDHLKPSAKGMRRKVSCQISECIVTRRGQPKWHTDHENHTRPFMHVNSQD